MDAEDIKKARAAIEKRLDKITEIYIEKNFIEMSGYKDDNFYICRYYPNGKITIKK